AKNNVEVFIMLDMKFLRNNFEDVKAKLEHRGEDLSELDKIGELDEKSRKLIADGESIKAKRNETSKQISVLIREKKDAEPAIKEMREVGEQISKLDKELKEIEENLNHMMLSIPNIPHESVPIGEDEEDNVVAHKWGELPTFNFEVKPHWEVGT